MKTWDCLENKAIRSSDFHGLVAHAQQRCFLLETQAHANDMHVVFMETVQFSHTKQKECYINISIRYVAELSHIGPEI